EIGSGHASALTRHAPDRWKNQIEDRIDHDRIGHGEKAERAHSEHDGRNSDKGIGGVKVAAEQEPGEEGAEAAAAQAPIVQVIEVPPPPMGRYEAEHSDKKKQENENGQCNPIHRHGRSSALSKFNEDDLLVQDQFKIACSQRRKRSR